MTAHNIAHIGLLGGSFNPPHNAHLALAQAALTQLHLSKVNLMPAGQPWQKSPMLLAKAEHRLAMCQAAVEGMTGLGVEPCETQRTGNTYTVDTLAYLKRLNPHIRYTLIIGADQATRLNSWHDWQQLMTLCRLAVVARNGVSPTLPTAVVARCKDLCIDVDAIHLEAMDVSSSAIRARITAGQTISHQVPTAVERYIVTHSLYKTI